MDPGALGVRHGPQKQTFPPNLSPPRVLGLGGSVIPFPKQEDEAKKSWERNFDFLPTAGENRAGRWCRPGGNKNFGISTFFYKNQVLVIFFNATY